MLLTYAIGMKHGRDPAFPLSVGVGVGCVIVSLNVNLMRFSITTETNPWVCLMRELLDGIKWSRKILTVGNVIAWADNELLPFF